MRITDIISETTSGAVASVAMGLGGGDPAASIYAAKPKKKKSTMIKRAPMENTDDKKD
jgi:hypothetical protein